MSTAPAPVSRRRGQVYAGLAGVVVGLLVAGLAVPLVFGESLSSDRVEAGSGLPSAGAVVGSTGPDATSAAAGSGAVGADAGAAGGPGPAAVVGGPSANDPTGGGAAAAAGAPGADAAGALPATDIGVTPTSIKLGFLLLDVARATRVAGGLTGIDPEQQKRAFEVYLAEINERGGINGRTVEGAYRNFDVLSRDDQRAACLELTQEMKVFAVIAAGGFGGPPILCVTEENQTPFINLGSGGTPSEYAERSGGRLFTLFQLGQRQMVNWVGELDRLRTLRDRKIGILSDESTDPGDLVVGRGLIPALGDAEYSVTYRSRLSSDLSVGASQIPVEVQQMRSKGVDAVLLPAHSIYSSQFVQTAEGQGWVPKYSVTDFANMSSDAIAENMSDSFEGSSAITVTRTGEDLVGAPEPAVDAACRERYEKATGESLPRTEEDEYNNTYGVTLYACGMVHLFDQAAQAAGAGLTRAAFSAAMQQRGEVALPRFGGSSFRAGKFDAADHVRINRWHRDCTCWKPTDQFHPGRA